MKRLLCFLAASFMLTSSFANAEDNFISDELFTYMHSGPGTQFRIIGSVNAGSKITKLQESGNYTQITDTRGRQGWVETRFVTEEPSIKTKLPKLESELAEVKSALAKSNSDFQNKNQDLIDSLAKRTERVKELETHTSDLNQQLINAQTKIRELSARIDTQKDDLLIRYFTYGGLVAGGGLLLGLVLPVIIPRRRKNKGGWA